MSEAGTRKAATVHVLLASPLSHGIGQFVQETISINV